MNLHEYQAKACFSDYGVPVPNNEVATSVEDAVSAWQNLGSKRVVVKAQVHAGGRGKAGGVRIVDNKEDLIEAVNFELEPSIESK